MAANAQSTLRDDTEPILSDTETDRRSLLLGELRSALAERGVQAVVGRHQRLALGMATKNGSGCTDPRLYIFAPDGATVRATADGTVYRVDDGEEYPVADPSLAAAAICRRHAPGIA